MDTYVPQEILDEIYQLTEEGKYEEAIKIINSILAKNPKNEQALLMITDVLYRQWNMDWADKAVSFLNSTKKDDPLERSSFLFKKSDAAY